MNPELVDPLIDWVDGDEKAIGTTGAEDFYYSGLDIPYRAANRGLTSLAELSLIKDYDADVISRITSFIAALPVENAQSLTSVNVNTASAEVLSLFSAEQPLAAEELSELIQNRANTPFTSVDEFANQFRDAANAELVPGYQGMLSVRSEFFAGRSCAESGRLKSSMLTLLQKREDGGNVKVLQRERFFGCPSFTSLPTLSEQGDQAPVEQ